MKQPTRLREYWSLYKNQEAFLENFSHANIESFEQVK